MSVFLGFLPHAASADVLATLQAGAREGVAADAPRHAWRTSRQWHMTLAYLGETLDEAMQARVVDAIAPVAMQSPSTSLAFHALQYWSGASVLVAKYAQDAAFAALHSHAQAALAAVGFVPEKRKPQPHVTLAYLPKGGRVPSQAPGAAADVPGFAIDTLHLLATRPGHYACLHAWPLAGTAP